MAAPRKPTASTAKKPGKSAGGRPSTYTPILGERVCELIAQGKSKRQISEMEGMPNRSTIDAWLLRNETFHGQYARACEIRGEAFAEELIDIADDATLDPQDKRVRIDARKWVASKLLPRLYGDSVTVKGDKDNPLHMQHRFDLTDAQLLAIAAGGDAQDG